MLLVAKSHRNKKEKSTQKPGRGPFPPAVAFQCPLLTKLNICHMTKEQSLEPTPVSQSRTKKGIDSELKSKPVNGAGKK